MAMEMCGKHKHKHNHPGYFPRPDGSTLWSSEKIRGGYNLLRVLRAILLRESSSVAARTLLG